MRRLSFFGVLLLALTMALSAAGPARAEDAAADPEATAPPDPGSVTPEPYDPSLAKLNKGECRKLARQIVQYADVAARASDRGDELWEQSTVARVDHLEERWNALCATEDDSFARMLNAAINTASRLAIKYFSGGWFD